MSFSKRIFLLCLALFSILQFNSCKHSTSSKNPENDDSQIKYDFSNQYVITTAPKGNDRYRLCLILQLPVSEGTVTEMNVTKFKVMINDKLVFEKYNFQRNFDYNQWTNTDGSKDSNYQMFLFCLAEDSTVKINKDDIVSIQLEATSNRQIVNTVVHNLADVSSEANGWLTVGKKYVEPKFDYNFTQEYKITTLPAGNNPDNLALVLQLPPEEGAETEMNVSKFEVYLNGNKIHGNSGFKKTIAYNGWTEKDGTKKSNYQAILYCLPENFSKQIKLGDKVKIDLVFSTKREIKNSISYYLIDNCKEVGYWITVGEIPEIFNYHYNYEYRIKTVPLGTNKDNIALVLQLPIYEGAETTMNISSLKLYINDVLVNDQKNFTNLIHYNSWTSEGELHENYQTEINLLPDNYKTAINKNDKINVDLTFTTERKIQNNFTTYLIDHSKEAGYWNEIGLPADQWVDPSSYKYEYNSDIDFRVRIAPSGTNPENFMLNLEQYPEEGTTTNFYVESLRVYQNKTLINEISDVYTQTYQGYYSGGTNITASFVLLPNNFSGKIKRYDNIHIEMRLKTARKMNNPFFAKLFDGGSAVNGYREIGGETLCEYAPTAVPNETRIYNDVTYKLKFYDDFDYDYTAKNPKKLGVYDQPQNRNNWYLSDFGTGAGSDGEHRCSRDFKIKNGIAEFPVVHTAYQYVKEDGSTGYNYRNDAPTLMTSDWDTYGQYSIPLHQFNKGIFEIRFKAPEGSHPGQFTFWVLNYNTDFEAKATNGRIPTNPYKASDGYALDEIDFFEYSPSRNCIRTGSRSSNSVNHRPIAGYSHYPLSNDFGGKWHTFYCVWDENGLTSYLDDYNFSTVSASSIKGFNNPNDKFMLLISSQAIQESGLDGAISSNFETYSYLVDYIKVYEKE